MCDNRKYQPYRVNHFLTNVRLTGSVFFHRSKLTSTTFARVCMLLFAIFTGVFVVVFVLYI